jgi:hypothetical protein
MPIASVWAAAYLECCCVQCCCVPADGVFTANSRNGDHGKSRSKGSWKPEYDICLGVWKAHLPQRSHKRVNVSGRINVERPRETGIQIAIGSV